MLVSDFGKLFVLPIDENVFGSGFKSGFGDYAGELAAFYGGVDDENLTLLQVYAYFYCQTCELFCFSLLNIYMLLVFIFKISMPEKYSLPALPS